MEAFTEGIQPITQLVLHSKEITIEEESVQVDVAGSRVEIQGFGSDLDREFFVIYLASPIKPGEVVRIALLFTSVLREDIMVGLYRSSYLDTLTNTTRCERSHLQAVFSDPGGSLPPILNQLTLAVLFPVLMSQPSRLSSIFALEGCSLKYIQNSILCPKAPTYGEPVKHATSASRGGGRGVGVGCVSTHGRHVHLPHRLCCQRVPLC